MNKKVEIAVKALDSKKAVEITALEIGSLTVVADYFVIAPVPPTHRCVLLPMRWNIR